MPLGTAGMRGELGRQMQQRHDGIEARSQEEGRR